MVIRTKICQEYKESQKESEEICKKLQEIENKELEKSDYDFYFFYLL